MIPPRLPLTCVDVLEASGRSHLSNGCATRRRPMITEKYVKWLRVVVIRDGGIDCVFLAHVGDKVLGREDGGIGLSRNIRVVIQL
mgnify:CR=1 FL=1